MLEVKTLTPALLPEVASLYQDFFRSAQTRYQWEHSPVEWALFKQAITQNWLEGVYVWDGQRQQAVGLLLFKEEAHQALEINTFHVYPPDKAWVPAKVVIDRLMSAWVPAMLERPNWQVVSFAMLGEQAQLLLTLPWYGFRPVGQAVVLLDVMNELSLQVFQRQLPLPALPEGFELQSYETALATVPEFKPQLQGAIYEAFHTQHDAFWDPRFRTLEGAQSVLALLESDMMGPHLPQCSQILLNTQPGQPPEVGGFCFLIQAELTQGNIPLIGLKETHKGRGLGKALLGQTIQTALQQTVQSKLSLMRINATVDTDNSAAFKMYRRFGFVEAHHYPHTFLTRERAAAVKPGQWCAAPPGRTPV